MKHYVVYASLIGFMIVGSVFAIRAISEAQERSYRQALISSDLFSKVALLENQQATLKEENIELRRQLGKTPSKIRFTWETFRHGDGGVFILRFTNSETGEVIRTEKEFW